MINFQYNDYAKKAPNSGLLSEDVFQNILENTFAVLTSLQEVHSEFENSLRFDDFLFF